MQAGRSAADYGLGDTYYVSWGGNLYQGSRALDFPKLRRVVSCEQDTIAYIALQESDAFFAKNLGVLRIPFSPDMTSPQTVTESVSGLTLDSFYDYQVTYTISVAQGPQATLDKTQANTHSYTVGTAYRGHKVLVVPMKRELVVIHDNKVVRVLPIKGLFRQLMDLGSYARHLKMVRR